MLLYLRSDRDKASLHKVSGRTGAGAQRHSTCQQSHRAAGAHSSLDFLHPIFSTSFRLPVHSFLFTYLFSFFSLYCRFFSFFFPIFTPTPSSPAHSLSGKVMHPSFLLPFGIRLKGKQREQCFLSLWLSS